MCIATCDDDVPLSFVYRMKNFVEQLSISKVRQLMNTNRAIRTRNGAKPTPIIVHIEVVYLHNSLPHLYVPMYEPACR